MEYPFTASPFKPKLDIDKFRGQGRGRGGPNHHRGRGGHFGGPPGGGQLKLTPGNWIIKGLDKAKQIWSFDSKKDDVWIVTPPKCGTTWTQELTWLLLNDLNFEKAKEINQFYRAPFIEMGHMRPKDDNTDDNPDLTQLEQTHENVKIFMGQSYRYATEIMKGQRLFKTHLPIQMLSPEVQTNQKIIYVGRNLKDVCVSLYHHKDRPCEFKDFAEAFKSGEMMPGDFPGHIKESR